MLILHNSIDNNANIGVLMFIVTNTRKSDKDYYNNKSEDFIPIACHYNANTLLTKNGELIQIIQINGINAENISDELFNLRTMVRSAIKKFSSNDYAFWIHTIRRKTNLDDEAPYNNILSANIHDMWKNKNFWHDKFVNTLYISIVHKSSLIRLDSIKAVVNSSAIPIVTKFQGDFLENAVNEITSFTDNIITELMELGATKLGIRFVDDYSFSDLLFLYRRIIHLNEENTIVPIMDLSKALASHKYAVGSDKIEVIDNTGKKFAAMLSIKEYQEVSAEALDRFLQIPVEMITTEIFYFVERNQVASKFEYQNYIATVSGDTKLKEITGIGNIVEGVNNKFCHQQISISIIGTDLDRLEESVKKAAEELSRIGIVHVREDINLEHTFWAQLPANFSFIRRVSSTILDNIAALASLHNFPTGEQYSPFGKPITLIRTEKGTPYFVNFHDKKADGISCIFGNKNSGKTVLTNFLVSEATKINPNILYFSSNNNSEIFLKAIRGNWSDCDYQAINPLMCEDNQNMRDFVKVFLQILCNHYASPLSQDGLSFVEQMVIQLFNLEFDKRNLSNLLESIDFSILGGTEIQQKLSLFAKDGIFNGVFDASKAITLNDYNIQGFNLYKFTANYFALKFTPDDKKLRDKFEAELAVNNTVRMALFYSLTYHFIAPNSSTPKILVIDNLEEVLDTNYLDNIVVTLLSSLKQSNGVVLSNIDIYKTLEHHADYSKWVNLVNISYIFPTKLEYNVGKELFGLKIVEIDKLASLSNYNRMFLVKQDSNSITAEISLGGLPWIVKILSADNEVLSIYREIMNKNSDDGDEWIKSLYEQISHN